MSDCWILPIPLQGTNERSYRFDETGQAREAGRALRGLQQTGERWDKQGEHRRGREEHSVGRHLPLQTTLLLTPCVLVSPALRQHLRF